ncbi:MAG: zf-HC2 domain-containing protein [Acidobacteriota bacterium]|nr:zf-HC2 domain-containing protein [Acidobacteriota bacterium]
MSARCDGVRERLSDYLEDALPAGQARDFREHLSSCDDCRDRVVSRDPSLLFTRVVRDEISAEDVARVLSGVRTGIALHETERKLDRSRSSGRRRRAALASAAAVAAMTLLLPGAARFPARTAATAVSPPVETAAPGFAPAARGSSRTFPADATIYDWNPGAGVEEPRVVWIVDRSLDI